MWLEEEINGAECEWDTFIAANGEICNNPQTKVIKQGSNDPDYEFCFAHLCNDHADRALQLAQEG